MGRPLHKKYFGNRNIGTGGYQITGNLSNSQNYSDDRIGGEGLASVSNGTVGAIQINNTYKTFPGLTVAAPTLPGGVTATTAVTWEIAAITVGGTNTGYTINQTGAAVVLTGLESQASVDPVITVNTNGSGNVSSISLTGGRGEFTSIDGTGITTWAITGAGGSNAQATVTFRVKSIAVVEEGSGYTGLPNLSWSQVNGGTMPSAQTPALTTDSGAPGSATNQENAIIMYANTSGAGSTGRAADVIKQVNTRTYKVKTSDGIGKVKLGTDSTPATGYAYMVATAESGGTYYVTKLTAHRATLVAKTGDSALDGLSVQWTLSSPTGSIVQIENA
jgi:hypothetical protein